MTKRKRALDFLISTFIFSLILLPQYLKIGFCMQRKFSFYLLEYSVQNSINFSHPKKKKKKKNQKQNLRSKSERVKVKDWVYKNFQREVMGAKWKRWFPLPQVSVMRVRVIIETVDTGNIETYTCMHACIHTCSLTEKFKKIKEENFNYAYFPHTKY